MTVAPTADRCQPAPLSPGNVPDHEQSSRLAPLITHRDTPLLAPSATSLVP